MSQNHIARAALAVTISVATAIPATAQGFDWGGFYAGGALRYSTGTADVSGKTKTGTVVATDEGLICDFGEGETAALIEDLNIAEQPGGIGLASLRQLLDSGILDGEFREERGIVGDSEMNTYGYSVVADTQGNLARIAGDGCQRASNVYGNSDGIYFFGPEEMGTLSDAVSEMASGGMSFGDSVDISGGGIDLFAGYGWVLGEIYLGGEVVLGLGNLSGDGSDGSIDIETRLGTSVAAKARVGLPQELVMPYLFAGFITQQAEVDIDGAGDVDGDDRWSNGYLGGLGVEWQVQDNMTARVELGSTMLNDAGFGDGVEAGFNYTSITAGIAMHF